MRIIRMKLEPENWNLLSPATLLTGSTDSRLPHNPPLLYIFCLLLIDITKDGDLRPDSWETLSLSLRRYSLFPPLPKDERDRSFRI